MLTRERVEVEKRKGFTPKQRLAVFEAAEGRCEVCKAKLMPGWQIDHILARTLGGKHEPANWRAICGPCHQPKSVAETKATAKINRIHAREDGTRKPRKPIPSPGFPKQSRPFPKRRTK